jgi:hypothetical protein
VAKKDPPRPAGDPLAEATVIAAHKPTLGNPKIDVEALRRQVDKDPRRMWQQAVDWTVTDPGLVVATAEFLMEFDEHGHAAEVLKAGLRKGLATDTWAHEALAIALQASGASPVEIERAAVSGIDLDPTNPNAYLKAAKAEADLKNHDVAVAFCRRAAEFGPDKPEPYANALAYAEHARDVKSDTAAWAAANLLHREWTADGINYQEQTKARLGVLSAKYRAAGQKAEALDRLLTEQTQRDLVIELVWQGAADLDLYVTEPSGSTCSATQKRTTGGGVLKADQLEQTDDPNVGGGRSEIYTAASAFSGTYKVMVKQAFGQASGQTATLKVWKFKGTPKESFDLISVDLRSPKSVEIKLAGGSRSELAVVTAELNEFRQETTGAPLAAGFGGGFGSVATSPAELPAVAAARETREAGIGAGAADIRAVYRLNPDRRTYRVEVNPVFQSAAGRPMSLPKVPLLPGAEK